MLQQRMNAKLPVEMEDEEESPREIPWKWLRRRRPAPGPAGGPWTPEETGSLH